MNAVDRADMCRLQMQQLFESVRDYQPHQGKFFQAGYVTPRNAQQNKTAIKRQITSLRQSLLALEKEVCE